MKRPIIFLLPFLAALCSFSASSATRVVRTINDSWVFTKEGVSSIVNIPHTWNAADADDDEKGFWRGECSYERTVRFGDEIDGREIFLRFEGAYQETSVWVNGSRAGSHAGGYTAFIFDITPLIRKGENRILVKVDSSYNPNIPTLTADFTFFGGIYRDVELISAPKTMISADHFASDGVYLTTPLVAESGSSVHALTYLSNYSGEKKTVVVEQMLYAPDGRPTASVSTRVKLAAAAVRQPVEQDFKTGVVKLWDIDDPQLYRVVTSVYEAGKGGALIDRVTSPLGFRTFRIDPDKGFFLNGRHVKIMGTNRHQDFLGLGNALPDEHHVRDVRLLKEMGGNFLRIAHYPQDPIVVQQCDREGIVNSVEIPIVDAVTCNEVFSDNCVNMMKEMVCQGFNHPSTIIWAYMNEILIRHKSSREKMGPYYDFVNSIASRIEAAVDELDPYRPTMIPCQNSPELFRDSGLGRIPDILGWNIYTGWYSGSFSDFGKDLDKIHEMFPDKGLILTEYGADNDWRCHSFNGERFDYSVEYAVAFHKAYIKVIRDRDYIAGSNVWNINDFYSEGRVDAVPHVNLKGLTTRDRTPKDSYWLYKAVLDRKPFLMIAGHEWRIRGGSEGDVQPVEVYTNSPSVELILDGKSLGCKAVTDGCATFDVCFTDGENVLEALASKDGRPLHDLLRVDYRAVPKDMSKFREMSVSLGGTRFFEDRRGGLIWIPEKEYTPGSWGYVGGETGRVKTRRGFQPYSPQPIYDTDEDPLYQMQRRNLKAFKADVPDGTYYVYLYFCELNVGKDKVVRLPYSLGNDVVGEDAEERVFDVSINGNPVLGAYNIREEDGECRPVIKKFTVVVQNGEGLSVDFSPLKGQPVLNAIRILKCN